MTLVKLLFLIGIAIAAAVGLAGLGGIFPWIVGGSGVVTGIAVWRHRTPQIVLTTSALVIALTAILLQPFNPKWLSDIVFFIRVFIAHVVLGAAALTIFFPPEELK